MSNFALRDKLEIVKNILKEIHKGARVVDLKEKYREVLAEISPLDIVLVEQMLVREGVSVEEILHLCDLHVELFREALQSRELLGLEKGHPLELLMRENEWILRRAELLGLYTEIAGTAASDEGILEVYGEVVKLLLDLKKIRLHYRKIQMLIFPYLERMGVIPIPRVMWGREDSVIVKLRSLIQETEKALSERNTAKLRELTNSLRDLSKEIVDLVFRENKILYPAVHALLPEGAWTVVSEIADEIGYIVEKGETSWKPRAPPVYPYEWVPVVNEQVLEKLPVEFKHAVERLKPDDYRVQRDEDLVLETGFLSREEIEGIFRSLPLELTFADANDRVRFYTESEITGGFVRTKTILGRRVEYCHPPRLEKYVMQNVEAVKQGKFRYREFWTKQGDRIIRVLVVPVKARDGRYLGVLEVVEDLTDVVEHPEEVKKKIMVL
ncbi:MAG: DUF438 domain-containing protein [Desulfurococcaceae archaeon]